jgi:hypothetical protein
MSMSCVNLASNQECGPGKANSFFGSGFPILAGEILLVISARTNERERRGFDSTRIAGPLPLPTQDYGSC